MSFNWFWKRKKEEEKIPTMAKKKKVTFEYTLGDAPKVTRSNKTFNILSPNSMRLGPLQKVQLGLGVKCDYPLALFVPKSLRDRGVVVKTEALLDAGIGIQVELENTGEGMVFIERTDVLLRAAVLDNTPFTTEDETE